MGFEPIDQPGRSSEVECNPKMSISYFWLERGDGQGSSPSTSPADHQKLNTIQKSSILFFSLERGGRWGSSPLSSPADHQKLNVIQKWAFYFLAEEGWQMGFESIIQPSRSSEVERNPKMSILYFWLERGDRWGSSPSTSPGSSEVGYFWLERGDGQGSSPLTSPADNQKLNEIQKWAFIFLANGVWVHRPARPIIRSWT